MFVYQLYCLPLEVLDIILEKSYLHYILNSPAKQRGKELIRSLISVDVCFNQRITRQRFKKAIWRYLNGEVFSECYSHRSQAMIIAQLQYRKYLSIPLAQIINSFVVACSVPFELKRSKVAPSFKPTRDKTDFVLPIFTQTLHSYPFNCVLTVACCQV